jgi:acyl-CoA synthetase (AMP-forming)/AMP-acid ligase II
MAGYWNLPEATEKALKGGWMHTGDAGRMDGEGYVYVEDRVKDMIISGGENIYPREVENCMFQHEAVADCAVIGIPSEKWGETVKAIVVLKQGQEATEEALIAFARERIARYKCPTSVEFTDVLPRNASGKVLKRELREKYWEGHTRRVS